MNLCDNFFFNWDHKREFLSPWVGMAEEIIGLSDISIQNPA